MLDGNKFTLNCNLQKNIKAYIEKTVNDKNLNNV